MLARLVEVAAVDDDLGAEAADRADLHRVRALRDADRAATPNSRAAKAIDWPWLPVEAVIRPRSRSSAASWERG